jgi:hypothetical protein
LAVIFLSVLRSWWAAIKAFRLAETMSRGMAKACQKSHPEMGLAQIPENGL